MPDSQQGYVRKNQVIGSAAAAADANVVGGLSGNTSIGNQKKGQTLNVIVIFYADAARAARELTLAKVGRVKRRNTTTTTIDPIIAAINMATGDSDFSFTEPHLGGDEDEIRVEVDQIVAFIDGFVWWD